MLDTLDFRCVTLSELAEMTPETESDWIWHGYLKRGEITLLVSQWKTGKTTLIAGLLHAMANGSDFLGQALQPAKSLYVTEESPTMWYERSRLISLKEGVKILSRPFSVKPTTEHWLALIDYARKMREAGQLDLLVIDPWVMFYPGACESDPKALIAALQPLQELARMGIAVLILHHPRKAQSAEGASARGTGSLLGFVDFSLELGMCSHRIDEQNLRLLRGRSRHVETPTRLVYAWDIQTGAFALEADPREREFEETLETIRTMLEPYPEGISARQFWNALPDNGENITIQTVYRWLKRAEAMGQITKDGSGKARDPFVYRLAD